MRIPRNRKWPIYTMPVGASFTVENPSRCLRRNLYLRAAKRGIVISTRRLKPSGFVCTRRA